MEMEWYTLFLIIIFNFQKTLNSQSSLETAAGSGTP